MEIYFTNFKKSIQRDSLMKYTINSQTIDLKIQKKRSIFE
jgi:hypothetical protein